MAVGIKKEVIYQKRRTHKKYIAVDKETRNEKITPAKKPIKAPQAVKRADFTSFRKNSSPRKLPTTGPTKIPKGPIVKIPTKVPIKDPAVPNLEDLYFFVPITGARTSTNKLNNVKTAKISKGVMPTSENPLAYA